MNFIKSMFISEVKKLEKASEEVRTRLQNIAWPSEAMAQVGPFSIGECKRAMFYKILGVKPTNAISVGTQAIFDAGSMFEKYIIDKYKETGYFIKEQIPIDYVVDSTDNKIIICGKGDLVINYQGKKKLIEIKSISAYKAPSIMGSEHLIPLPAANNLMQAMLYKYFLNNTEVGKQLGIDEVYLQYVNRSDGSTFFYKVDISAPGYPIVTAYDSIGQEIYSKDFTDIQSFEDLSKLREITSTQARLAELKININDIFKKYDETYTSVRNRTLPDKDYSLVYTEDELELNHSMSRISALKYNKMKKGKEVCGDSKCQYCSYQKQCLKDSGINLI